MITLPSKHEQSKCVSVIFVNGEAITFKNFLNSDGTYPQLGRVVFDEVESLRDIALNSTKTYKLMPRVVKNEGNTAA